jgi:glutamate---cysteine ligase / carboxylate-amine ligase
LLIAKTGRMRTVGVEEELLLVEQQTGAPTAIAERLLQRWKSDAGTDRSAGPEQPFSGAIEGELQQQQIEIDSAPCISLADLERQIRGWRGRADQLARTSSGRAVAIATSPLAVSPEMMPSTRYRAMAERFGLTTVEQLTCGCHVHVGVDSPDEGVAVIDRIRIWLPVLLALSANSPFWQAQDTGYASYRSQAWRRFPTAGPTGRFGTVAAYRARVSALLASDVPLDEGMIYFDARLSHRYPTVEVRVPDVCLDAADTVVVAGLVRALVETAARSWATGEPAPSLPTELIRMASWRASRSGLGGQLLDPSSGRPRPAAEVVESLFDHVRSAAADLGDEDRLRLGLDQLLARGPGASWQRAAYAQSGSLPKMILEAADRTLQEGC